MVTLYSTHCPKCMVLETKLKQNNIEFNIETDTKKMIEKGFTSAPMLEADDRLMDFGEAIKWLGVYKSGTDLGVVGANECSGCGIE